MKPGMDRYFATVKEHFGPQPQLETQMRLLEVFLCSRLKCLQVTRFISRDWMMLKTRRSTSSYPLPLQEITLNSGYNLGSLF
jgi:hypothetical protein